MECVIDSDSRRHLVLTRRAGESIFIGNNIEIFVVAIATPTVRLEITIHSDREEPPISSLVSCDVNERIRVSNQVDLLVQLVRGREARLGIVAPTEIPVLRSELFQKVARLAPRREARSTLVQRY